MARQALKWRGRDAAGSVRNVRDRLGGRPGRFERTAAGYVGGGGRSTHQTIASWIGSDLACIVAIERHETRLEGKPATFRYRVTHLFRRENGDWKVVLRHADPLVTFLGPQFAHFTAQAEDVA